jgi:hypothetical protein
MSKHPQNRFRRLAIVGPTEKKPLPQPAGQRWWGPRRPSAVRLNAESQNAQAREQFRSIRMAVMPTLSRGMWLEAMASIGRWIADFVRSYFVTRKDRERSAVVLSFRRRASLASGFRRPVLEEGFVSKKANGSVRWNSDREVAPQEGGRG